MANLGFREVADALRTQLKRGRFQPGEFLPSESELCAKMHVSRTTIRRALGTLEVERLITVIPGRGRLVGDLTQSNVRSGESRAEFVARILRDEASQGSTSVAPIRSAATVAGRLGVSKETASAALKMLAAEGLVTAVPGYGWRWTTTEFRESKTDQTTARLRSAIDSGEWPVGTRLPGEVTLAKSFGVGRVTVRRAIKVLVSEGLLQTNPGIGAMILRSSTAPLSSSTDNLG
ncbi:GntR family transcriptional regulator [Salinispora arenicola]|uniref:GntR family transcriptional regulator n=1 Tax=Salinispora arenicola TaxID=168697 RepID=UPI0016B35BED|nr:GntR family transcriptional regulator [Salinispora arenicola]NIL62153.1 GntR family transcriptional regulator [Salinispora arenicola]